MLEVAALSEDRSFLQILLRWTTWTRTEKGIALCESLVNFKTDSFEELLANSACLIQKARWQGTPGRTELISITPFRFAIEQEDIHLAQTLISAGSQFNQEIFQDGMALYAAVNYENLELVRLVISEYEKARPGNPGNVFPETLGPRVEGRALNLAVSRRNLEILEILLRAGADLNRGSQWNFPLGIAMKKKKDMELIKLLLANGANVNRPPDIRGGRTALQLTVEQGNMALLDFLLEKGADVNQEAAKEGGGTALQLAAIRGYIGITRKLLYAGADVNAPGAAILGRTALEGAAEWGGIDMIQLIINAEVSTEGHHRKNYIRAVVLSEANGHFAASKLLKSEVGWLPSDIDYYEEQKLEFTEWPDSEDEETQSRTNSEFSSPNEVSTFQNAISNAASLSWLSKFYITDGNLTVHV